MDFQQRLKELSCNLYWTWRPEMIDMFRDIDPVLWREANHNPVEFLSLISSEKLEEKADYLALNARINHSFHHLKKYLQADQTWGNLHAAPLHAHPVAYFSAEFGLHESLPLYSGGLGVLAGDHLKSASDLGVPVVGVGLFYAHGYFNQKLSEDGWQKEDYFVSDVSGLPIEKALRDDGSPVEIEVNTLSSSIQAHVWSANVGRNRLLLLDSDVESNSEKDRSLTATLYGGDERTRIRQELLLGVGGLRTLLELGIQPGLLHLNEGHSAFAILEYARRLMEMEGRCFADIRHKTAQKIVFTTHTPVESGHDSFDPALVEDTLEPMRRALKLPPHDLLALGRVNSDNHHEHFCMTVLGLKMSNYMNAVSALHAQTTRKMWRELWPHTPHHHGGINYVTNGIHTTSWLAVPLAGLYTRHLGQGWQDRLCRPQTWEKLNDLDHDEFWEHLQVPKTQLVKFIHRRVCEKCGSKRRGNLLTPHDKLRLHPETLTIGFSRRFSEYKRAFLILEDLERLDKIINNEERPVQLVFSGKAHPADQQGKQLLQQVINVTRDPRFQGRVIFIEDYDINVARHLVQGVDVWLNTPRRPLEACGTSGQKVVLNGGLNLSTFDGWWPEAYDGQNGFCIGNGSEHANTSVQDERDTRALYDILEETVIPMFYNRPEDGVPYEWVAFQKHAIRTLAWRFNAARMVKDYTLQAYLPAIGGATSGKYCIK